MRYETFLNQEKEKSTIPSWSEAEKLEKITAFEEYIKQVEREEHQTRKNFL